VPSLSLPPHPLAASGADLLAPISSPCASLPSLSRGPRSSARPPVYSPLSVTGGSRLSDLSAPNRPRTTRASLWTPRPRCTPRSCLSPPRPFSSCLAPARPPLPSLAHSQPSALASYRARVQGVPSRSPWSHRRSTVIVVPSPCSLPR
jgi:hypothetical protein